MSLIPYVKAPKKVKGKKLKPKQKKVWIKKKKTSLKRKVEKANRSPYKGGCFAKWRNRTWKVTADQINTISEAKWEGEWDPDKKKKEPGEAKFSFPLYKDLMPKVNVASEIRSWNKLIGKTGYLYLGGTLFGSKKRYRLTGVVVKDVELFRAEVIHCYIELTFLEVKSSKSAKLPKRRKKKTTKKKTTAKKKATNKKKTTTKK